MRTIASSASLYLSSFDIVRPRLSAHSDRSGSREPAYERSLRGARRRYLHRRRIRRGLEVALHCTHHKEVHRDIALVRLALEFVVKPLWHPHGRCDPLLRTGSARHASTVTLARGLVVDGDGWCAARRALLTLVSRCARLP